MDESGVAPNLGTLNAVLECLSMLGNPRVAKGLVLTTLSEFKKMGIEPSLGSYFFVLNAFCKEST
jgi:pentatricopeptide repeat domain-containing protein 3